MKLTYVPGKTHKGKVDFIFPFLDEKSRTVKVRLVFANSQLELKPGMLATVILRSFTPKSVIVVPSEVVIQTDKRNRCFY